MMPITTSSSASVYPRAARRGSVPGYDVIPIPVLVHAVVSQAPELERRRREVGAGGRVLPRFHVEDGAGLERVLELLPVVAAVDIDVGAAPHVHVLQELRLRAAHPVDLLLEELHVGRRDR